MKSLLPFLIILACPLMMIIMMRGMHGSHEHGAKGADLEARPDELRRARAEFQAHIEDLDERIRLLEGKDAETDLSAAPTDRVLEPAGSIPHGTA